MITAYCLTEFAGDPYYNMAVDEWLLETVQSKTDSIVFRTYTWQPGAITFGLNQRFEKALDHSALGSTPLIRRVTGGRALYHEPSELTYSIAGDLKKLTQSDLTGSLTQTSRRISEAIVQFLSTIGQSSELLPNSKSHPSPVRQLHTSPCFESAARHEIIGEKGKIVASAQRRIGSLFLQHGAIKLKGRVSHPALDKNETATDEYSLPQPLTRKEFTLFSELLFDQLCQHFGFNRRVLVLSQSDKTQIHERQQYTKKVSLERRVIKQIATTISL